jgi:hypothetical protein
VNVKDEQRSGQSSTSADPVQDFDAAVQWFHSSEDINKSRCYVARAHFLSMKDLTIWHIAVISV